MDSVSSTDSCVGGSAPTMRGLKRDQECRHVVSFLPPVGGSAPTMRGLKLAGKRFDCRPVPGWRKRPDHEGIETICSLAHAPAGCKVGGSAPTMRGLKRRSTTTTARTLDPGWRKRPDHEGIETVVRNVEAVGVKHVGGSAPTMRGLKPALLDARAARSAGDSSHEGVVPGVGSVRRECGTDAHDERGEIPQGVACDGSGAAASAFP